MVPSLSHALCLQTKQAKGLCVCVCVMDIEKKEEEKKKTQDNREKKMTSRQRSAISMKKNK